MGVSHLTKLRWFDLGAQAFEQLFPGELARRYGDGLPPLYVCPTCRTTYPKEAVADGVLTEEHVPPESFGGRGLLLTCHKCNSTAGSKLDAHARRKENIIDAVGGRLRQPMRVKITLGSQTLNAEYVCQDEGTIVRISGRVNPPGAGDALKELFETRRAQPFTVDFHKDRFTALSAKISWLRSGYLALVAACGYRVVFAPAMQVVRRQILEPQKALLQTFMFETNEHRPWTERRILHVLEPAWHKGWAVQFGRYCVLLPEPFDSDFYNRIAKAKGTKGILHTQSYEFPTEPSFGLTEASASS